MPNKVSSGSWWGSQVHPVEKNVVGTQTTVLFGTLVYPQAVKGLTDQLHAGLLLPTSLLLLQLCMLLDDGRWPGPLIESIQHKLQEG